MKVPTKHIVLFGSLAVILVTLALGVAFQQDTSPQSVDVITLVGEVQAGAVESLTEDRDGRSAVVDYVDASTPNRSVNIPTGVTLTELFGQAEILPDARPKTFVAQQSAGSQFAPILKFMIIPIIVIGAFLIIRKSQSGFGKGAARRGAFDPIRDGETSVLMSDVAGSEEVKEEISDIIDFLREPEKFHRLGAQIPRGALLVGPPGTGKTLLARAVAGEAQASFFSVSGSEFVELYVGVGASRVRELFKRARECAPSIIFIDEIDSIGRKRGRADSSTEYDQTLNQILVEMDGFDQRSTVVVIAATNRVDILDSALLRPGRFDRKVHVDLPDRAARGAILRVHARGKPIDPLVNLDELAARTTGMSGADLANVLNEGAILCGRRNANLIDMPTLLEAVDRTMAGAARKGSRFSMREREIIAYHEAGHALVAHLLPDADTVRKVSIVSRGRAGGYTMIIPEEDRGLWTRRQLTDRLAALLGGYAAETIVFGDVTTGSSNDLDQVSNITLSMVAKYGMGRSFGLLSAGEDSNRQSGFSQRTSFAAETEASVIVETAFDLALSVITERRSDLELIAQRLLEVETIENDHLIEMLGPAATSSPLQKRATTPLYPVPVRAVRPAQPGGKPSRIERAKSVPGTIAAFARFARVRQATR